MKVGLYFGSFNPIHHGHLIVANFILENSDLDQLWFVVSPQNPLKPSSALINEYHRLNLVQVAIEGETRLKASDIEFRLPKPSYTVNSLAYLKERYPENTFTVIMGSDNFKNIKNWKNYEYILEKHPVYVYNRPGYEINKTEHLGKVSFFNAPKLEISATHIRNTIKQGKSIRYLVPDKVMEEIRRNGYYRN